MRDALLSNILQAMQNDKKIFFLTADFGSPVLDKMRRNFPDRFINVGIAEQNLINISAGLALEGFKVFAYAIAPFITMRCYEQIRVNLALLSELRDMNVNLIGVGAGYSYVVSGPTHQCYEDLTIMRAMPNMQILSPSDHISAGVLFDRCSNVMGPKYIRLDAQILPQVYETGMLDMKAGFHVHANGNGICLVATGYMLHTAIKISQELKKNGVHVGIIDMIDLVGFDSLNLSKELKKYDGIVTMEEGFRARGGLDALFVNIISMNKLDVKLLNIGVEGGYRFELGTRNELHEMVGIGKKSSLEAINKFIYSLKKLSI